MLSLETPVGDEENSHLGDFIEDKNARGVMQREGVFREMKRRKAYEKPSERKTREKAEAVRRAAQGGEETGPARRLDPHAEKAGACAPSGAAAQVLSLLRTRSCAARSADLEGLRR